MAEHLVLALKAKSCRGTTSFDEMLPGFQRPCTYSRETAGNEAPEEGKSLASGGKVFL
jgi:hypothetical protein